MQHFFDKSIHDSKCYFILKIDLVKETTTFPHNRKTIEFQNICSYLLYILIALK